MVFQIWHSRENAVAEVEGWLTWVIFFMVNKNIDPENGQKSVETKWQLMATNDPITPAINIDPGN